MPDFSQNKHYKIAEHIADKYFNIKPEDFKKKVIDTLDKTAKDKQLYSKELNKKG